MVIISPSSKIDGIPISFWCDEVLFLQLVLWPFFFSFLYQFVSFGWVLVFMSLVLSLLSDTGAKGISFVCRAFLSHSSSSSAAAAVLNLIHMYQVLLQQYIDGSS